MTEEKEKSPEVLGESTDKTRISFWSDESDEPVVSEHDENQELRSLIAESNERMKSTEKKLNQKMVVLERNTQHLGDDLEAMSAKLDVQDSAKKSIGWRLVGSGEEVPDLRGDTSYLGDIYKFQPDIFAFMFCYKPKHVQFWFGLFVVLCLETMMVVLLLANSVDFTHGSNPFKLPGNIGPAVRATQFLALVVAVFYEDDFREGIEGLVIGRPSMIRGDDNIVYMSESRWRIAHVIRIIAGGFVLVASFLLLVQSETVFDVLLNFLGLSFASELSKLAFMLCLHGYFGSKLKRSAQKIEEAEYRKEKHAVLSRVSFRGKQDSNWWASKAHSIIMGVVLFTFFVGYAIIFYQQYTGAFITPTVYVEFGDQIVPFLGIFNGCYKMNGRAEGHPTYKQIGFEEDGGMFAFCPDVNGSPAWTFSAGADRDPCDNWQIKSGETDTYELYDAGKENWYTPYNSPLEFLQISEIQDEVKECGRGMFEKAKDSCDLLEPVGALSVMSKFRSESYKKLLLDTGTDILDEAHAHPIYIHTHEEDNHTVFDLILFTGRRWALTDTDHIEELKDESIQNLLDLERVTEFFRQPKNIHKMAESEQHWISLLSQEVPHAIDNGSPVDLKWYEPEYHHELVYTFPSPKILAEDIHFECELCNNSTHPCQNDGFCEADGVCHCVNGATGAHCQDKPLSDGTCNTFFNKKSYSYDGGDCCGGTCNGLECGYDGVHSAFGKNLSVAGFGFENCNNPEMALLTLEWKNLQRQDYCDNGGNFCAIVALNLLCDGRTYLKTPEVRLDAEEDCDGPFHQTVLVPYGSTCTFSSSQDYYDVYYEFAMYYGLDDTLCLIHESNQDTSSVWFHIPTHCFSDVLEDHVESFFDDSIQAQAVETLSQDTISDRLCDNDPDLLVERYALKVLNASVALDNRNFKAHQCQGWGGSAVKIECDADHKITYLYIKEPRTEGTIPTELALLSQLSHLDFFGDPMIGQIPVELSLLTNLEFLDLGATNLTGTIPVELFQLTNMKWLGLFEIALSGYLPSEISMMQKMTKLDLHNTELMGTLHTELGLLSDLISLEIGASQFNGPIPTEIGRLKHLKDLSLYSLNLQGSLPSELGLLTGLTHLELRDLGLSGTVPAALENLSLLTSWDLGGNAFEGTLPAMFGTDNPTATPTTLTDPMDPVAVEIMDLP